MNIEAAKIVSFYSGLRFKGSNAIWPAKRAALGHSIEMTRPRAGNSFDRRR